MVSPPYVVEEFVIFEILLNPADREESIGLLSPDSALLRSPDMDLTFLIEASIGSEKAASQLGRTRKGPFSAGEEGR